MKLKIFTFIFLMGSYSFASAKTCENNNISISPATVMVKSYNDDYPKPQNQILIENTGSTKVRNVKITLFDKNKNAKVIDVMGGDEREYGVYSNTSWTIYSMNQRSSHLLLYSYEANGFTNFSVRCEILD